MIVLSVFNGFSSVVTNIYVSFDPHVRISALTDTVNNAAGTALITNADSIIHIVKQFLKHAVSGRRFHGKAVCGQ